MKEIDRINKYLPSKIQLNNGRRELKCLLLGWPHSQSRIGSHYEKTFIQVRAKKYPDLGGGWRGETGGGSHLAQL